MANNRLWLVYRPTGKAVYLGKRMADGWYGVPDDVGDRIIALFQHINDHPEFSQDDMLLSMEECLVKTPFVSTDWKYKSIPEGLLNTLDLGEL